MSAVLFDVPVGEGRLALLDKSVVAKAVKGVDAYLLTRKAIMKANYLHADAPALEEEELQEIDEAISQARACLLMLRRLGRVEEAERLGKTLKKRITK